MPAPHASLWWATLPREPAARAALAGDLDVDVAIVGAGYTGLWTALALKRADMSLRVAVLEADVAGAGASGRNGGWASALYPISWARVREQHGGGAHDLLISTLREAVVALGADARSLGIDCDYHRGGTVTVARTTAQVARLRAELDEARLDGTGDDDLRWLEADEALARCGATGVLGALFTPHCAAIHPAKLATGLADSAERLGIDIYERTRVSSILAGDRWRRPQAACEAGIVRAEVVVRATEGFTPGFKGARRAVVPLYSLMVATDPLPGSFFERIGLADRETFNDGRHLLVYGQRTRDDRLAFGGRGAPYHFGSRVAASHDADARVFATLEAELEAWFGPLPAPVAHRWGGPLAMARDGSPFVVLDRGTGLAAAGGYVGDGVVMSRVAAIALADVILGRDSEYSSLPFVGHRSRDWEPEPLRWIGINAGLAAAAAADAREARTGRASVAARLLAMLQGS